MADLEQFKDMLNRAGVVFEQSVWNGADYGITGNGTIIKIYAKEGPNNLGYSGFSTEVLFSELGNMRAVASWE